LELSLRTSANLESENLVIAELTTV
jgi:hypothetical protein